MARMFSFAWGRLLAKPLPGGLVAKSQHQQKGPETSLRSKLLTLYLNREAAEDLPKKISANPLLLRRGYDCVIFKAEGLHAPRTLFSEP